MILATKQVEDFDRFLSIFSTKGAEKRKQHGSKGATVFRDPNETDRVWVLFDLGCRRLAELRVRPGCPADHAGSRTQGSPPGRGARRKLRRLALPDGGSVLARRQGAGPRTAPQQRPARTGTPHVRGSTLFSVTTRHHLRVAGEGAEVLPCARLALHELVFRSMLDSIAQAG
jgi:hypothetical protein